MKYLVKLIFSVAICSLILFGCAQQEVEEGSIVIHFTAHLDSRIILPDTNMEIVRYDLVLIHDDGERITAATATNSIEVYGLQYGDWLVEVSAYNAAGIFIGYGETSILINHPLPVASEVIIRPVPGNGNLELLITWPVDTLFDPALEAELIPISGGENIPLTFTLSEANRAQYRADSLPAGYYILAFRLLDFETVVLGDTEVIRIISDQLTRGELSYSHLNNQAEVLHFVFTPEMEEPIEVDLNIPVEIVSVRPPIDRLVFRAWAAPANVRLEDFRSPSTMATLIGPGDASVSAEYLTEFIY